jgi:hypothetical protein
MSENTTIYDPFPLKVKFELWNLTPAFVAMNTGKRPRNSVFRGQQVERESLFDGPPKNFITFWEREIAVSQSWFSVCLVPWARDVLHAGQKIWYCLLESLCPSFLLWTSPKKLNSGAVSSGYSLFIAKNHRAKSWIISVTLNQLMNKNFTNINIKTRK